MDLAALIEHTRSLAGDPTYQGNSNEWSDEEIVFALNWAQNRYAELTHCTYAEVDAVAATGSDGVFEVPPGFILVDRVMIPAQAVTAPNASITVPATAPANSSVAASVPAQAGATYFWTVAGGTLSTGQGTNAITFQAMAAPGGIATVSCIVRLNGQVDDQSADVALT